MNTAPFSNPTTSLAAAREIEPHLGRMMREILEEFRFRKNQMPGDYGLTADELEQLMPNMRQSTVSGRVRDLVKAGILEDSGEKRGTRTGRAAIVWRLRTTAAQQEMAL